jgi:hypothetical protein
MRMRLFGALMLTAGITAVVLAQQPRGGGFGGGGGNASPARMLGNKTVQEELKLTDDQVAAVKGMTEKITEMTKEIFAKGKDMSKEEKTEAFKKIGEDSAKETEKVTKDLKPEQTARLKQLQLQVAGVSVLAMPEDAVKRLGLADEVKKITLTDDQKGKFKETADARSNDAKEIKGFDADSQKKREALNKEYAEKFAGILTDEQKKTWTEMTGKAVEIKFDNPFGKGKGKPKDLN